jgi:hypothetical protein
MTKYAVTGRSGELTMDSSFRDHLAARGAIVEKERSLPPRCSRF